MSSDLPSNMTRRNNKRYKSLLYKTVNEIFELSYLVLWNCYKNIFYCRRLSYFTKFDDIQRSESFSMSLFVCHPLLVCLFMTRKKDNKSIIKDFSTKYKNYFHLFFDNVTKIILLVVTDIFYEIWWQPAPRIIISLNHFLPAFI